MINPFFYTTENQVQHFAKVKHYPRKDFHKVITTSTHVIAEGDTIYNIAKKYFGSNKEYHWTYVADINHLRVFTPFENGEVIKVPSIAVSESAKRVVLRLIKRGDEPS